MRLKISGEFHAAAQAATANVKQMVALSETVRYQKFKLKSAQFFPKAANDASVLAEINGAGYISLVVVGAIVIRGRHFIRFGYLAGTSTVVRHKRGRQCPLVYTDLAECY
jgi:hypothetical protein